MSSLDGSTNRLDTITPHPFPRTFPLTPEVLPYHILGFGSFTAEGTGLPVGKVLGEVAIEHTEAARVHLADGHLRLVPCPGRNEQINQGSRRGRLLPSPGFSSTQTLSSASSILDLQGLQGTIFVIVIIVIQIFLVTNWHQGTREKRGPQMDSAPETPSQKLT